MSAIRKYHFYIDDSGSRFPDKADIIVRSDGMDHFALGGILIADDDREGVMRSYKEFCRKWNIEYPLHSTKIRGKRDDFAWLESSAKTNEKFLSQLETFLLSLPITGFAAVIYRPGYNARYKEQYDEKRWWMCKTAFSILVECIGKYLKDSDGRVTIRFEEVGKREDRALIGYARELKNIGMPFNMDTSAKYNGLAVEDFKTIVLGEPRRGKKRNLFMQLADLYLYPMVKRKYDPTYNPWVKLFEHKKVIDALVPEME